MTPAQLTTLKAAILAETTPAFVTLRQAGNEQGMADFYNADSGSVVWQTAAPVSAVQDAVDYTAFTPNGTIDGTAVVTNRLLAAQTKQINLQLMLQGKTTLDATPGRVRGALLDATTNLPTGTNGALQSAAGVDGARVLNALTRPATRGERLYTASASTTGTVSAFRLSFEGSVTAQDVSDALRA
jgi:hypothetical protein